MTIEETKARLYHHANLPSRTPPDGSLCYLLYKYQAGVGLRCEELIAPFQDVLSCLAELNKIWNGPVPSARIGDCVVPLDRQIAYSVSEIIASATGCVLHGVSSPSAQPRETETLAQIAHGLAGAWDCVLAGDIDDVREEVRLELLVYQSDPAHAIL